MREIKFRAWDKQESQWHSNVYIHIDGRVNSQEVGPNFKTAENFSICQYTGLKDKNGVEIYEGGIVKHPHFDNPLEIRWVGSGLVCYQDDSNWVLLDVDGEVEVIGNIFENPELIR